MSTNQIRNFCIIAHIDHGKSTLADRFLEITGTVSQREKRDQILDSMDLERERGITIKMEPVTMQYYDYTLNLIDTPGHVDFAYEVSRALAAVDGAILVVDATQGIQAQTLANLYKALELNLDIIPVINKIDLKNVNVEGVRKEMTILLGVKSEDIIPISAKNGENVINVLQAVIERVSPPKSVIDTNPKALIFDSYYDKHRGVVCDVRIFNGEFRRGDKIRFYQVGVEAEIQEVGIYVLKQKPVDCLSNGSIGYIITGLKEVAKCKVGDTVTGFRIPLKDFESSDVTPLPGYKEIKPVVFANLYPKEEGKYFELRKGLEELKLNDSSLTFSPAASIAIGKGFKAGFLGLLHLDIIKERLAREYGLELVLTVPQVEYHIKVKSEKLKVKSERGEYQIITSPQEFPENQSEIEEVLEPWVRLEIITPAVFIGSLIQLVVERRGIYQTTDYLESSRVILYFELPLAELLTDFYDKLKSISSGYASLSYEIAVSKPFRPVDLVKLNILVAGEEKEPLAMLVPRKDAERRAREVLEILKKEIPPALFEIRLQASIHSRIIASERIRPLRKDVTAKLYGGDVTRKMKLLEKQRKGKKKMAQRGSVEIPSNAYLAVLGRQI